MEFLPGGDLMTMLIKYDVFSEASSLSNISPPAEYAIFAGCYTILYSRMRPGN